MYFSLNIYILNLFTDIKLYFNKLEYLYKFIYINTYEFSVMQVMFMGLYSTDLLNLWSLST